MNEKIPENGNAAANDNCVNDVRINDTCVREMTCICCPVGCQLTVTRTAEGQVTVTGNTCKRGADYGEKELVNPTRIVTSTVRVADRLDAVLPVRTASDIPKGKMMECMEALAKVVVTLPVRVGDVVLENVADTGVNIVATRDMT